MKVHAGAAVNIYDIRARFTHIDRAIIRGYFQYYCRPSVIGSITTRMPAMDTPWWQTPDGQLPRALHAKPLPAALERMLSALSAGYQRVLVDDDVVLIDPATREIVDVMRHARAPAATAQPAARKRNHVPRTVKRHGDNGRDSVARWRLCERITTL
jgi:hypothetical protein